MIFYPVFVVEFLVLKLSIFFHSLLFLTLAQAETTELFGVLEFVDNKTKKHNTIGIQRFTNKKYLITIRLENGETKKIPFANIVTLQRIPTQSGPFIFTVTTTNDESFSGATSFGEDKGSYTRIMARGPIHYRAINLENRSLSTAALHWPYKTIQRLVLATNIKGKKLVDQRKNQYLLSLAQQEKLRKKDLAERNKRIQIENQIKRQQQMQREKLAKLFRKNISIGDDSHCGLVIEVKKPIVKIQTVSGEKWFKIKQLYPKGARPCRFINGQYSEH